MRPDLRLVTSSSAPRPVSRAGCDPEALWLAFVAAQERSKATLALSDGIAAGEGLRGIPVGLREQREGARMLTMFDVRSASEEDDDKLRAFIRQTVGLAAHHANLAGACAELGDDKGLKYALKCFAASSRATFETFAEMKANNLGRRA